MEMKEVFENLKELQDVLSEKYSIEAQIDEAPKSLTTQDEDLHLKKKEFIVKSAAYEEKRKTVGNLKAELAEAEAARERGEKGMDSITTHREYEALQKEIDDATNLEQKIRKDLQREEKNLAELDEALEHDKQIIDSSEAELNAGKEALDAKVNELKEKLESLKEAEQKYEEGIDPDIIFKFERIIKSKQGKGIVAVKGNVCDGCHMILPGQFANEVRNGDKIVFCPYCSRILFYEEVTGEEEQYFQMDAGSLADLDDDFGEEEEEDEDGYDDSDSMKELDF